MTTPAHVAIIMDGNGRWAQARGLPRLAGHQAGVAALRQAVRTASDLGVRYLTVYAFSSENWSRPQGEVSDLMGLLKLFVRRDLAELHRNNVRVRILGDRTGLKKDIAKLLDEAEATTRHNTQLQLLIAFNYGSRDEIVRAARKIAADVVAGALNPEDITIDAISERVDTAGVPDPELIIRTSGEMRLSNFLLWQSAYSELVFLPCYWPDFDAAQFADAIRIFNDRERRFGGRPTVDAAE
jgi:undecaprenyl diphosphate synthase